ncbi:hypothetical protein LTS08_005666 [Lithohypha guttulata]|nr:hypothetical protein LTS08_005666 [Lithohypha guttulata]
MEAFSIRQYQQHQLLQGSIGPEYCPCGCGRRYNLGTREVDPPTEGLDLESLGDEVDNDQGWGESDWTGDSGQVWEGKELCDGLIGDRYTSEVYQEGEWYEERQEDWGLSAHGEEVEEGDDRGYDYYEDGIFENDLAGLEDEELEDDEEERDDSEGEEQSELDDDDDDEAEHMQQTS